MSRLWAGTGLLPFGNENTPIRRVKSEAYSLIKAFPAHLTLLQNVATFAILWIQKGASYEWNASRYPRAEK
jgi:hypothetical protein